MTDYTLLYNKVQASLFGSYDRLYRFMGLWLKSPFQEFIFREIIKGNPKSKNKKKILILSDPLMIHYQYMLLCFTLKQDLKITGDGLYLFDNDFFFFSYKYLTKTEQKIHTVFRYNDKDIFDFKSCDHYFLCLKSPKSSIIKKHLNLNYRVLLFQVFIDHYIQQCIHKVQEIKNQPTGYRKFKKTKETPLHYFKWCIENLIHSMELLCFHIENGTVNLSHYNKEKNEIVNIIEFHKEKIQDSLKKVIEPSSEKYCFYFK